MKALAIGIVLLLPSVAHADIFWWRDAHGVRHFTNLQSEVPAEQRQSAQVIVDEAARQAPAASQPAAQAVAPAPEPPREAQVVYDRSELAHAYLEGWQRGIEAARGASGGAGGAVQINGPLAIANASAPPPAYDYTPYLYPLVTTSFDRGRSRHLTLRMLLEDQFALDRAAPFVYEERLIPPFGYPPLGVDLNPFLPRGLPHGFPRDVRVIVR